MKKMILWLGVMACLASVSDAHAAWVDISKGLNETDLKAVAVDPKDSKVILAASQRRLYLSKDGGVSWKQSFGVRGNSDQIRYLYFDPLDTQNIYAATDRGLRRSKDGGKHWELFFEGIGEGSKKVFCVAGRAQMAGEIWMGTEQGVVVADPHTGIFHRSTGSRKRRSILFYLMRLTAQRFG